MDLLHLPTILTSGTLLITLSTLAFNYGKQFLLNLTSLLIVRCNLTGNSWRGNSARLFELYAWKRFKRFPFGKSAYGSELVFIKANKRFGYVGTEYLGTETIQLFWNGLVPIWVSGHMNGEAMLNVSYLRWTFNIEKALINAFYEMNNTSVTNAARFKVQRVNGTLNRSDSPTSSNKRFNESGGGVVSPDKKDEESRNARRLGYSEEELGEEVHREDSFEHLYFSDEVQSIINELKFFTTNKEWFINKKLPWRRGWLLYGKPGTGKSSIVKALAQKFDLPVKVFDLTTTDNRDFFHFWHEAQTESPCVVLLEDLDCIFNKRDSSIEGGITFDCFLNVISGVGNSDGIFLVITTNHPEKLDDAIAGLDEHNKPTRPGRIDKILELKELTEEGRSKMASRILSDFPELISDTVLAGVGETGAQFQERCAAIAIKKMWSKV